MQHKNTHLLFVPHFTLKVSKKDIALRLCFIMGQGLMNQLEPNEQELVTQVCDICQLALAKKHRFTKAEMRSFREKGIKALGEQLGI